MYTYVDHMRPAAWMLVADRLAPVRNRMLCVLATAVAWANKFQAGKSKNSRHVRSILSNQNRKKILTRNSPLYWMRHDSISCARGVMSNVLLKCNRANGPAVKLGEIGICVC